MVSIRAFDDDVACSRNGKTIDMRIIKKIQRANCHIFNNAAPLSPLKDYFSFFRMNSSFLGWLVRMRYVTYSSGSVVILTFIVLMA